MIVASLAALAIVTVGAAVAAFIVTDLRITLANLKLHREITR